MPLFRISGKNVLFIHVPKTGGTTVEKVLAKVAPISLHGLGNKSMRVLMGSGKLSRGIPLQHLHAKLLESIFAPGFIDYAFIIVRDPVSRMVSEYRHSRALGRPETRFGFSRWLRISHMISSRLPEFRNNHFRPQAEYPCFGAEVLRFEDGVPEALARVAGKLGVALPAIPHERRSEAYEVVVTDADRAFIADIYADDYSAFGYVRGRA